MTQLTLFAEAPAASYCSDYRDPDPEELSDCNHCADCQSWSGHPNSICALSGKPVWFMGHCSDWRSA